MNVDGVKLVEGIGVSLEEVVKGAEVEVIKDDVNIGVGDVGVDDVVVGEVVAVGESVVDGVKVDDDGGRDVALVFVVNNIRFKQDNHIPS